VMLFSSCEKQTENITDTTAKISAYTPKTQIDPDEEFDGITFGMTDYDIIAFLGKKPDFIHKTDDELSIENIDYLHEEHFNISNAYVEYHFNDDHVLNEIKYFYTYDESEQEQLMNDYEVIKEEILRRYPEEISTFFFEDETFLMIYTENRNILFSVSTDYYFINLSIEEYRAGIDPPRPDTPIG
ncbi:MAG: hypothetical protein J1F11_03090, partial [Oscillospiraceae bacterium]|nr:hypothetical protein [Oscillospiraceae bacterium]